MTDTVSKGPTGGDDVARYLQSIFFQFRLQRCHLPVPLVTHLASRKVFVAALGPDAVSEERVDGSL